MTLLYQIHYVMGSGDPTDEPYEEGQFYSCFTHLQPSCDELEIHGYGVVATLAPSRASGEKCAECERGGGTADGSERVN